MRQRKNRPDVNGNKKGENGNEKGRECEQKKEWDQEGSGAGIVTVIRKGAQIGIRMAVD